MLKKLYTCYHKKRVYIVHLSNFAILPFLEGSPLKQEFLISKYINLGRSQAPPSMVYWIIWLDEKIKVIFI